MLLVDHLTKIYGTQRAVDNISFTAIKGEVLGFLGPNGAGKSTTMKIATGYIPATQGSVNVCGYDVQQNPIEVQKHIGYLPEHNPLYLDMYVKEYLQFSGSIYGLKGQALNSRIKTVIDQTGLGIEQNKKNGALSKGYRQRVGIAQALIHNPDVLILDEPTTGLDPNQIVEIRQLIKNLGKDKTVILSTHIMQEVQAICSRYLIINKGVLVADSATNKQTEDTKTYIFIAEFETPVPEAAFAQIHGVLNATAINDQPNCYNLEVSHQQVRADIFRWAAANNKVLLGLKAQEENLEQVFRNLTSSK